MAFCFPSYFEFNSPQRIIFGKGKSKELGKILNGSGFKDCSKAMIVTGKRGWERGAKEIVDSLIDSGMTTVRFSVDGEPTVSLIREGIRIGRESVCDMVVGIGGGSALDAGKAISALLTNPGDVLDYMEVIGKGMPIVNQPAPYVALPTTAGTGAEVTKNAVLLSEEHMQKCSLRDAKMIPRLAIIDPELTYSLPKHVTTSTGLDAFTQLLESFLSIAANPVSDAFAYQGLKIAAKCLERAATNGKKDHEAREGMCIASTFGGLALANSKLGAVHGFAGVIGGLFSGTPHGSVCASLLPYVVEANFAAHTERATQGCAKYHQAAQIVLDDPSASATDLIQRISVLCKGLDVPRLSSYGLKLEHFPQVVEKSAGSSSMQGNSIKLTPQELTEILEKAM